MCSFGSLKKFLWLMLLLLELLEFLMLLLLMLLLLFLLLALLEFRFSLALESKHRSPLTSSPACLRGRPFLLVLVL